LDKPVAASVSFLEKKRYQKVPAGDRVWPRLIRPLFPKASDISAVEIRPRAEARAEPRRPVQIPGKVELAEGGIQDCLILDLSPGGALIELDRAAAVGETIKLRLTENGEFSGTVRWRGTVRMGVKFDHFGGLLPSLRLTDPLV